MAKAVTIKRPEIVALIERAASKLTRGNKTEAVAVAMRRLLESDTRAGSLFGAHLGSPRTAEGHQEAQQDPAEAVHPAEHLHHLMVAADPEADQRGEDAELDRRVDPDG